MTSPAAALHDTVRASPLAAGLDDDQARVLAGLVTSQWVQPQQVLAHEGQPDNRLYVVAQGELNVVKHMGTPDETLLAVLKPGDFAHELGFLDGAERYATLKAGSEGQILLLERERLETLIDSNPRLLYALMCTIVRTVHRVQTRLSIQASELTNYIVKQHGRY